MTASTTSAPPASGVTITTIDAVLSPLHDTWIEEVHRFLGPAMGAAAPFWDRWSAVRYLNDRFVARYAWERSLLDELRPFMTAGAVEDVSRGGARVAELRLALDRIGRRRGTAAEFGEAARLFIDSLQLWCAEIELATRRIDRSVLASEGRRILEHLEAGASAV